MAIVINRAELTVRFTANQSGGADFGGPIYQPQLERILQFANGVAANQFDRLFVDHRVIAASADDNIDLTGSLQTAFGTTLTEVEIVGLLIFADADNPGKIRVGDAAANPWGGPFSTVTQSLNVEPGGIFCIWAPGAAGIDVVVAGTGDILAVHNGSGAGSAEYDIAIAGRSA